MFSSPTPKKRRHPEEPSSPKPKSSNQSSSSSSKPKKRIIVKKPNCIVMEFSTQNALFRTRALALKELLEDQVPDIIFDMNPNKPRKGCFEIRNDKGETFISLLKLKDPYDELMYLDLRKLAVDISNKITGPDNQQ